MTRMDAVMAAWLAARGVTATPGSLIESGMDKREAVRMVLAED